MGTPHVHADVIKQWADGAEIEYSLDGISWVHIKEGDPRWDAETKYRVRVPYVAVKYRAFAYWNGTEVKVGLHMDGQSDPMKPGTLAPYNMFLKWLGDWKQSVVEVPK